MAYWQAIFLGSFLFISTALFAGQNTPQQAPALATDLKNVDLKDALRILAAWDHHNVVLHAAIRGSVTVHIEQSRAREIFNFLLKEYNLALSNDHHLWYVAPIGVFIKQKQAASKWQDVLEESSVLATHIWQLRYAKAQDLAQWLKEGAHSWLSKRGHVHIDVRTNILCIQDTEERLKTIAHLIKRVDVPVQQVLIQARLASVDHDYEQELGLRFSTAHDDGSEHHEHREAAFSNNHPFSLAIAQVANSRLLDLKLFALENAGHGELISNPSLFTASQQTASIETGEEIPYQEASSSGATTVVFKKAVLSLKVTPQVLPGKKILLQLQVNQDRPSTRVVLGVPAISTRQIITNVLLPSGHTVVLGGVYEASKENNQEALPFLSKIPLLGKLFQLNRQRSSKRELLVFVTPIIVE